MRKNLKIFFVLRVFYLLCFFPSTEHVFVYSTKVNSKTTTQSVFYPKARECKLREPIAMTQLKSILNVAPRWEVTLIASSPNNEVNEISISSVATVSCLKVLN